MNSDCRRTIEMGSRALEFVRLHPDQEPGMVTAAARLEQSVTRGKQAATVQREGIIRERTATAQKVTLCARMREIPIPHLAEIGRAASVEQPELAKIFRFRPEASTLFAFRTAARSMANAAQEHRELLVKYGLSESVLAEFVASIDQLDAAVALGTEGRAAHMGATQELKAAAVEIARAVRAMDGRIRQRFAGDPQVLGAWIGASRVLGTPRPETESEVGGTPEAGGTPETGGTPGGGEVRPVA
jgi:hypothetical protein